MNERPPLFRRVSDALGFTDASLSMVERLWAWRTGIAAVLSALGSLGITRLFKDYIDWWTALFVAIGTLLGVWLNTRLTARHLRRAYGIPRNARDSAQREEGDSSPIMAKPNQKMAELEAEVDALRKEGEAVATDFARTLDDRRRLTKEIGELRAAVQNRQSENNNLRWIMSYGSERPTLPDMPLDEQKSVRERIEELTPSLNRANDSCLRLLKQLVATMRLGDTESCTFYLGGFVHERVFTQLLEAREQLELAVRNQHDVRYPLIGYYQRYRSGRDWVTRAERILSWPQEFDSLYLDWRNADKVFEDELEKVLHRSTLAAVRQYIENDSPRYIFEPAKERARLSTPRSGYS